MREVREVRAARGRSARVAAVGLVTLTAIAASCAGPRAFPPPSSGSGSPRQTQVQTQVMLAWTPEPLSEQFSDAVAQLPEVSSVAPVASQTVWLTDAASADGRAVEQLPTGQAIPLQLRAAELKSYAPLLPAESRAQLAALGPDEVVLGVTSAGQRRVGPGATLTISDRRLRVAGVVADADIGFAEVFTSAATAARLGVTTRRYLFIKPRTDAVGEQIAARVRGLLPPDAKLHVVGPAELGRLEEDDAVLPSVLQKQHFGEFAVHQPPGRGGWLRLNQDWSRRYLATEQMPILGRVTCNVAMLPALRSALDEIVDRGLSSLVDKHDFGGCYAARLIPGQGTVAISRHAWGSAIDLNVGDNPLGGPVHQDPRLVEIFRSWGFTWGGDWLVPDPMHFEFIPSDAARAAG